MIKIELIKEATQNKEEVKTTYRLYQAGKYEVDVTDREYKDGNTWRNIGISKDYNERFLPEIFFSNSIISKGEEKFNIQTTSYGSLEPDEIKQVIEGYEYALEAVRILTEKFI